MQFCKYEKLFNNLKPFAAPRAAVIPQFVHKFLSLKGNDSRKNKLHVILKVLLGCI